MATGYYNNTEPPRRFIIKRQKPCERHTTNDLVDDRRVTLTVKKFSSGGTWTAWQGISEMPAAVGSITETAAGFGFEIPGAPCG